MALLETDQDGQTPLYTSIELAMMDGRIPPWVKDPKEWENNYKDEAAQIRKTRKDDLVYGLSVFGTLFGVFITGSLTSNALYFNDGVLALALKKGEPGIALSAISTLSFALLGVGKYLKTRRMKAR